MDYRQMAYISSRIATIKSLFFCILLLKSHAVSVSPPKSISSATVRLKTRKLVLRLRAGAVGDTRSVGTVTDPAKARAREAVSAINSKLKSLSMVDRAAACAAALLTFVVMKYQATSVQENINGADTEFRSAATTETYFEWSSQGLWHAIDAEMCIQALGSSSTSGLSNKQVAALLVSEGFNELNAVARPSLWNMVAEQFDDRLVQILLGVAILSGLTSFFEREAHAFIEPAVILTILVLNAAVGVWQSRSAEGAMSALQKLQPSLATVLRNGEWASKVSAKELVPGDVILLRVGDKIPADARLLQFLSSTFSVDEGSLTGESTTVSKSIDPVDSMVPIQGKVNMVFSGTVVTVGSAYAVVTSTGMQTEIGKIQAGVQAAREEVEKTPLGHKLDEFGEQLSGIIGYVCLAVWLINFPRFFAPAFASPLKGAMHYLKVAVALGVAAIPEGLPAVITLCLSLGTRRMTDRNVIVRKLPSVETLGCTTVICTDKTGTLTTNQMTVSVLVHAVDVSSPRILEAVRGAAEQCHVETGSAEKVHVMWSTMKSKSKSKSDTPNGPVLVEHTVEGIGYSPRGTVTGLRGELASTACLQDVIETAVLCNDATLFYDDGMFQRMGEPTEAALKVLAEKLGDVVTGTGYEAYAKPDLAPEEACRRTAEAVNSKWRRIATLEFNRDRKTMSVVVRPRGKTKGNVNRLLVKGAPDLLLQRCTKMKLPHGGTVPLTNELRDSINRKINTLAEQPLRTIGFAVKEALDLNRWDNIGKWDGTHSKGSSKPEVLTDPSKFKMIESGLTFVGLCGITDPARPMVADSIRQCHNAGIRVMMITGDSKPTAVAIAKDIGMFPANECDPFNNQNFVPSTAITETLRNRNRDSYAFTGKEFFVDLPEEEQMAVLRYGGNLVFCRTEPIDKQKLVKMLQKIGEIPAMTGDGVNDAPALQQAAIGVAMGITGTEVAKEAADMVLADDNFATIVSAVEEGRSIYNNMQSFICFLISCNFGEIATVFLATLFGLPEPLTSLQLLWVNLVTDGPPATALGFNPPSPGAMSKPPRGHNEPILTPWLLTRYIITGLYVGASTIGIMMWWLTDHGVYPNFGYIIERNVFSKLIGTFGRQVPAFVEPSQFTWSECKEWTSFSPKGADLFELGVANLDGKITDPCAIFIGKAKAKVQTITLSVLVCTELLKALSATSMDASIFALSPFRNPILILAVAASFGIHLGVLQIETLANIFGLTKLSVREWRMVASFAVPILVLEEILKFIGRRIERRSGESHTQSQGTSKMLLRQQLEQE